MTPSILLAEVPSAVKAAIAPELVVAVMAVLLLLLFAYWRPRSAALKWSVLVMAVFVGMALVRYVSS